MPAGTWNQNLIKRAPLERLATLPSIVAIDRSGDSNSYFNITHMPAVFTSGKNLIKLNAAAGLLVDKSKIHFEILDSAGNPLYYEPLDYLEKEGTRVLAIYVYYGETAPGPCTLYIAGRARISPNDHRPLPFSNNPKSPQYKHIPNMVWQRKMSIAPQRKNSTEIIQLQSPRVNVTEQVVPFMEPTDLLNVQIVKSGSLAGNNWTNVGTSLTIEAIPLATIKSVNFVKNKFSIANHKVMFEGALERNSPNAGVGGGILPMQGASGKNIINSARSSPAGRGRGNKITSQPNSVMTFKTKHGSDRNNANLSGTNRAADSFFKNFGNIGGPRLPDDFWVTIPSGSDIDQGPTEVGSYSPTIIRGYSIAKVDNPTPGFAFSASMEGGYLKLENPRVEVPKGTQVDSSGKVFRAPRDSALVNHVTLSSSIRPLTGSHTFKILTVLNTGSAHVTQIDGPQQIPGEEGAFCYVVSRNVSDSGSISLGPRGWEKGDYQDYDITTIKASTNFTSSHIEPFVTVMTQNSMSFAEIVIGNMEPATGDTYKVKTLYKPVGSFGNFIDAGDTIIENVEHLEDRDDYENIKGVGMIYNRLGYFTDKPDFEKYWTTPSKKSISNQSESKVVSENLLSITHSDDYIRHGIQITPHDDFGTARNRYGYVHISSSYQPILYENTTYYFYLNATVVDSGSARTRNPNGVGGAEPGKEWIFKTGSRFSGEGNSHESNTYPAHFDERFSDDPAFTPFKDPIKGPVPLPRIDIYVSGSEPGGIESNAKKNQFLRSTIGDPFITHPTQNSPLEDGKDFGVRIGSIELSHREVSVDQLFFSFKSTIHQQADIFLIPRRGTWAVADISLESSAETGFTPNYTRMNIRIPTEYMMTPLAFKFEYYDYKGTKAAVDTTVAPIIFVGNNEYISGDHNLLSGSLYVGNTIGHGIEISGQNSAYLRSIGYAGYSASLATGNNKSGGFMIFSGSILSNEKNYFDGNPYNGVGLELVADDDNGHLIFHTNPSVLDIKTDKFFLGSDDSFISGSGDGTIAISGSNFELSTEGNVTMQGTITATAGGVVGGWEIGSDHLVDTGNNIRLDSDGPYYISSSEFQVNVKGAVTASAGVIAGWDFDDDKLSNDGVHLSSSYGLKVFDGVDDNQDFIEIKYQAADNWGLLGKAQNVEIFQLGNTNHIAGWKFDNEKIISDMGVNSPTDPGIVLKANGTIETDPFISGLTANATGWQIRSDGRAEFENAVIRGTLSTAVFEKDTISVVGGQVMVANAAKIDNVNPRFTTYPYTKTARDENINWSGEELPATASGGVVTQLAPTFTANEVYDDGSGANLWWKISNNGGNAGKIRIDMSTGSYTSHPDGGLDFRLTFYAGGNIDFGLYHSTNTYSPQYSIDGGPLVSATTTDLTDGFHTVRFSSSADWGVAAQNNVGIYFTNGTATTGDVGYVRDIHCMHPTQSLVVDNAGGWVNGEFLVAKSTDQGPDGRQGFVREYMRVQSSSLGASETPASGTMDFGSATIGTYTNITVTASKHYTFTGVATETPDVVANNQYYFVVGATKQHSLTRLKDKIVEEVLDMFVMTTGSLPNLVDQLYFLSHGVGTDGNAYGFMTGSVKATLEGAVDRVKPTLAVERNMDALVNGNERGYWIDRIKDGQSLASQGSTGTGYILMNAQPTDDYSPYIDIVERQDATIGGQIHTGDDANSVFGEVTTVARIGDLGGITDFSFADGVSGYGIYTGNGYFKGRIEVISPTDLGATFNFGGPSGSSISKTFLIDSGSSTGSQWITTSGSLGIIPSTQGTRHRVENGVLHVSSSDHNGFDGEIRTLQTFERTAGHSLVFDMTMTSASSAGYRDPAMMIGWGDSSTPVQMDPAATLTTYKNTAHAFYFIGDFYAEGQIQVRAYEGPNDVSPGNNSITSSVGTVDSRKIAPGDTLRGIITPNPNSKGARYQLFKYPNLSQSIADYDSIVDGGALQDSTLDVGIWSKSKNESFSVSNIEVTVPGQLSTVIEGGKITTGKIRSTNWGASQGSEIDLDQGTITLGGSDTPDFQYDGTALRMTGSLEVTSGDVEGQFAALKITTASINLSLQDVNNATGSYESSLADLNLTTASINLSLLHIAATTASQNSSLAELNLTTGSIELSLSNVNNTSGSWESSLSSLELMTGSIQLLLEGVTDSGSYLTAINMNQSGVEISGSALQFSGSDFVFGNVEEAFISGANGNIQISASNFEVTPGGNVIAASFTERWIEVTEANSASYYGGFNSTQCTFIADGSAGGEVSTNYVLRTPPYTYVNPVGIKAIKTLITPLGTTNEQAASINFYISCSGVEVDGVQISYGGPSGIS